MIGLFLPLDLDTNTVARELRNRPLYRHPTAITRLHDEPMRKDLRDFDLSNYLNRDTSFTQLESLHVFNFDNGSTWKDIITEDFDVVSRLNLSNTIKMKVKIKSITKFIPKIVLD